MSASPAKYRLPSHLIVVADSAHNLAITKFMSDQLGLSPRHHAITENPPTEFREAIAAEFHGLGVGGDHAPDAKRAPPRQSRKRQ